MSRILVDQVRSNSASGDAITLDSNGKCAVNATTINNLTFPTSNGSANQVIKTDGSGGLSFTALPVGGKILQVVAAGSMITNGNTEMAVEANSSTGNVVLQAAQITPSATNSKILVAWTIECGSYGGSSNSYGGGYLKRGTVGYNATTSGDTLLDFANGVGSAIYFSHNITKIYYDSPNTTDAREYTLLLNRWSSGSQKVVARRWLLVLMEIAG